MSGQRRTQRLLLAAVVVGFLARAAFAFLFWQDRPLTIDQVEYLLLAEQVLEGEGLTYPAGDRRLMRSPGYPLFLAAIGWVAPGQDAARLVQCLLGALAILQVAWLARRLAGERAGMAAAWLTALYPPLVFEPAYMLSEPLYTALALGVLLVAWDTVDASSERARRRRAVVTGLLSGAVLLVRPEFALFVGLLGLLLLWRRQALAAVLVGLAAVVVVAPWPLYNVLAHDRVILLSSRGGPNFWMGNNPLALGDGDVSSNPPMAHEYVTLIQDNAALPPEDLERLFYRRAGEFIRDHTGQWALLLVKKAFWFVVPFGPSYRSHSTLFFASHAVSWLLLLGASIAAWPQVRRLRPFPVVLALAAASVTLTSLIFFPLERYRVPLLDPVLIVCVATWGGREGREGRAGG